MTTANDVYKAFADSVIRIMDDPEREWRKPGQGQVNDFCGLAIAGESLRRLCQGHFEEDDGPQPYAFETLDKYDQFLSKYEGETPTTLEDDLESVLLDLRVYAGLSAAAKRDEFAYSDACNHLEELEQILMLAVASWRARRALDEHVVLRMGNRAREAIFEMEERLTNLAEFAWRRELNYGSDPNFIGLYDFWDQLSWYAPSHLEIMSVVRDAARKERIIEKVMDGFKRLQNLENLQNTKDKKDDP